MALRHPARLPIASLGVPTLPAGQYLYAGSAWGPGGIRARLGRHQRPGNKRHWHIDHLIAVGTIETTIAFPGARECEIVAFSLAAGAAGVPVPGFGASDCRICPSHLLAVEPALVRALQNRDSRPDTQGGRIR